MKQLLIYLVTFLLVTPSKRVQAQDVRFADFLERMPRPMATLDETMAAYGSYERMDNEMKYTTKEIEGNLKLLYTPVLELFNKRLAAPKTQLATLSKEERDMVEGFRTGSVGFSEGNKILVICLGMESRPLLSSGKLSWTKLHPAAAVPVQKLYQQLKQTEGLFDWARFNKEEVAYRPKFGEIEDETIKTLQREFDAAIKKLPKKKVMEQGIPLDIEDPVQMLAILEKHRVDLPKAFEQWYSKRYKWWAAQYEKLVLISQRLDELATQAGNLASSDADQSILFAIRDLQARTWEAWQKLSFVSHGFFMDAMVVAASKKQVDDSIEIYRKYKESSE